MTFEIYPPNGTPKQRLFSYRFLLPLLLVVSVAAWYGLSNLYYLRHLQANGYKEEFGRIPEGSTVSQTVLSGNEPGKVDLEGETDPLGAYESPDIVVVDGGDGHGDGDGKGEKEEEEEQKGPLRSNTTEPFIPYGTKLQPLTDITFTACIMPSFVTSLVSEKVFYSVCGPAEDNNLLPFPPAPGTWHRLPKNLNYRVGWGDVWLWYKRLEAGDDESHVIKDITLLPHGQKPEEEGWIKHRGTLRAFMPPQLANSPELHLWIKKGENSEKEEAITEVDVTYGHAPVQWGWEVAGEEITSYGKHFDIGNAATMVKKKGNPVRPDPPKLKFSNNGDFSILQIADLHFSSDVGHCFDISKTQTNGHEILDNCRDLGGDATALKWLDRVLMSWLDEARRKKTDYRDGGGLVVLSGDQLNGQKTTWDPKTALLKVADIFVNRRIAWTIVFGDHDDEDDCSSSASNPSFRKERLTGDTVMSRKDQMEFLMQMPYFLASPGPTEVAGVGNYLLSVTSPDESSTDLLNLYFLDSHAYDPNFVVPDDDHHHRLSKRDGEHHEASVRKPFDWIKQNQIDWYKRVSNEVTPILRPWSPSVLADGDSTFGLWGSEEDEKPNADAIRIKERRRSKDRKLRRRAPQEERRMKKPNALMFFHIPIQEAYADPDVDPWNGEELMIGEKWEPEGSPAYNSGIFHNAILTQKEEKSPSSLPEVKALSFGHSHATSTCRRVSKVWLCFGSGSSYSGYGRDRFERGVREYAIEAWGEKIWTGRRVISEARQGTIVEKFWVTGQEEDRWIWD
ncbi:hypothetical protein BT69DRAFT_1295705 [Atractiella rhizophila]|nr:hypothetical protein BT69DRAFT_1295705 [Atractiella rhizophila]